MGWKDEHLFAFQVGRQTVANRIQLADLIAGRIKRLDYLYDLGDSWQHTLRIDKTVAADPNETYTRLIDGAGRWPPEDCGGIGGFYAFLEAMNDPQHPDHDGLHDWYGGTFDPTDMGVTQIKDDLARIAARRKRPAAKP